MVNGFPLRLRKNIGQRNIHQYKFRHYCRTVVISLGVFSEIENHCNLNNKELRSRLRKFGSVLAEYNADAKDIKISMKFVTKRCSVSSVQLRDIGGAGISLVFRVSDTRQSI